MTLGLYERAWDLTSKPRNTPVVQASAHGFSAFDKCFELDLGTTPLSSPSRRARLPHDAPSVHTSLVRSRPIRQSARELAVSSRLAQRRSPAYACVIAGTLPRDLTNSSLQFFTCCPASLASQRVISRFDARRAHFPQLLAAERHSRPRFCADRRASALQLAFGLGERIRSGDSRICSARFARRAP